MPAPTAEPVRTPPRASAPVVGVVLLIGLTVVMATTVAVIALGQGLLPTPVPQVEWEFDPVDPSNVTITHAGGPAIDGTTIRVTGTGVHEHGTLAGFGPPRWTAGTSATVPADVTHPDTTVVLVWTPPGGGGITVASWSPDHPPPSMGDGDRGATGLPIGPHEPGTDRP